MAKTSYRALAAGVSGVRVVTTDSTDTIHFLKPVGGQVATKQIALGLDGRSINKIGYPRVKHFHVEPYHVSSIKSLAAVLAHKENDFCAFAIRGDLKEGSQHPQQIVNRRLHDHPRKDGSVLPANWQPASRQWVMLDLDKIHGPDYLDPFEDPEGCVAWVQDQLPKEFHDTTVYWQFSSSQNIPKKIDEPIPSTLCLHLWFWLNRPVSDTELKLFFDRNSPVDRALFNAVQAHYTAPPIFLNGLKDPLPRRSGLIEHDQDVVTLPTIDTTPKICSSYPTQQGGREARGFENIISLIGDGPGLIGFHEAILRSTASFVVQHGENGTDVEYLKSRVRGALDKAPKSPSRSPVELERYASEKFLNDIINGAITKFGQVQINFAPQHPPEYPNKGVPIEQTMGPLKAAIDGFFDEMAKQSNTLSIFDEPIQNAIDCDLALGKSEQALRRVAKAIDDGYCGVIAVPQHALSRDLFMRLSVLTNPENVGVWLGYDQPDPFEKGHKMCRHSESVSDILKAMGSIEDYCGSAKSPCQYKPGKGGESGCEEVCGYWRQRRETTKKVWIITSNMLAKRKPANIQKCDFLIIDEDFTHFMLHGNQGRYSINRADLLEPRKFAPRKGMPQSMVAAYSTTSLSGVQTYLENLKPGYFSKSELLDDNFLHACQQMKNIEWSLKREMPSNLREMDSKAREELLGSIAKHNNLVSKRARFWGLLSDFLSSDNPTTPHLHWNGKNIRLAWKDKIRDDWKVPTLYLDATLNEKRIRQWLPELEVTAKIKVEATHVHRVQVTDIPFAQNSWVPDKHSDESHYKTQRNNADKFDRFLEVIATQHRGKGADDFDVVVIAQKGLIEYLKEKHRITPTWDISRVGFEWLNNIRGVDKYKGVSAEIITGRLLPPPRAVEFEAGIIFGQVIEPVGEWYQKRAKRLRMVDGASVTVSGDSHPNPEAESCRWQVCEAELLQAEGRGRGNRRTVQNPLTIYLCTNVCLPLTIHETVDHKDLMARGTGVRLMETRGIVPDDWRGISAVLNYDPIVDIKAANAARQWFNDNQEEKARLLKFRESANVAETPSSLKLGVSATFADSWTRLRYRLPGTRKSTFAWIKSTLDPATILEKFFGPGVQILPLQEKQPQEPQEETVPGIDQDPIIIHTNVATSHSHTVCRDDTRSEEVDFSQYGTADLQLYQAVAVGW